MARMDELFAVDAEARCKALTIAARHVWRQERAKPLMDDIRSKIEAAQSVALPSSALSKACQTRYALEETSHVVSIQCAVRRNPCSDPKNRCTTQ